MSADPIYRSCEKSDEEIDHHNAYHKSKYNVRHEEDVAIPDVERGEVDLVQHDGERAVENSE